MHIIQKFWLVWQVVPHCISEMVQVRVIFIMEG